MTQESAYIRTGVTTPVCSNLHMTILSIVPTSSNAARGIQNFATMLLREYTTRYTAVRCNNNELLHS